MGNRAVAWLGLALGLSLISWPDEARAARQLGDLSGSWQLFADDHLVARTQNVTRSYHAFQKLPVPVMVADRPWESNNVYLYGTVLAAESGSGYRMWYHCYDYNAGMYRMLYAVSADGLIWQKPNLGLVDYKGSTANNIFLYRTTEDHTPQIIHTPWESDAARRYKMINFDYGRTPPDHTVSGYWGAWSPDGIHFTPAPANPVLPDPGDVGNFVWDPLTRRYMGFPKKFADVRGFRRRCVGCSATTVFEQWPVSQLCLVPDEYDDRWVTEGGQHTDFYGLSGFAYESMYIGFLWVFRIADGDNDGPIFVELVTSHDGVVWIRQEPPRTPVLPLGPEGTWDCGMVFTPNHPLVENGEIKLYYGGWNITHAAGGGAGAIGLATLRKDGFASLDAGSTTGTVTTRLLSGASGQLQVNCNASGGWLAVEVLDQNGQVISGYNQASCNLIQTDSVDRTVTWGLVSILPVVEPIRLRFIFRNASLYSFRAGDAIEAADAGPAAIYTFEGDSGATAADKLSTDGVQAAVFQGAVLVVTDRARSAFGNSSVAFAGDGSAVDTIEIERTFDLGRQFTLAAMIKPADNRLARLFSSYLGSGSASSRDLIFDFDPTGTDIPGLRCTVQGTSIRSQQRVFADGAYHHLAMTYDDGAVSLYLDGNPVGAGTVPAGSVWLTRNLHFGQDTEGAPILDQTFDSDALGSAAGWQSVAKWFGAAAGTVGVANSDAVSTPNGLNWQGDGSDCQLIRPWGFASDGVSPVTVSFDFKVVSRGNWVGMSPFVYRAEWGGTVNGAYGWPVLLYLYFADTSTLTAGFNYYEDGAGWVSVFKAPADQLVGNWFRISSTLYPSRQTVDVSVTQLTGSGAGARGWLTGRHFQYGYVTEPGWYTPALDDLRGSQFYAWGFQPDESILLDNFSVQAGGSGSSQGQSQIQSTQFRGNADDVVVIKRVLSASEIATVATQGIARLYDFSHFPDFDGDGDVDQSDFGACQTCMTGADNPQADPACAPARLDDDADVDAADLAIFLACMSGDGIPADPNCDR
ncbi:MAG: hypothetical protein KA354_16055 [Phycisphaerae bacterium]|nr:hypothetical protein [Phycisphaerae bacterium]